MKFINQRRMYVLFATLLTVCLSSPVIATEKWEQSAKSYFENGEYEKCIDLVNDYKSNKFARMFLAFSHLQQYTFNKTKYDKEMAKNAMMILKDKVKSEDIDEIFYFINQKDQPPVVKEAHKLLKAAFKNCRSNEDVKRLIPLLNKGDQKTRDIALKTIKDIIAPKRAVVSKGGSLRRQDIDMMTDPNLIKSLFENALASGTAGAIIVLIEQPALKYSSMYEGKKIMDIEAKIAKAIAKREKKYPKSNWYSASGKKRD